MRYLMILIGLMMALPTHAADAVPASPKEMPTATLLATSSLLGMKLSVRKRQQDGKIGTLTLTCVEQLDVAELVAVFQTSLEQEWGQADLATSDAFFLTPLGKKVATISLLDAYERLGAPPPEPAPTLSSAEQDELGAFSETSAGRKLYSNQGFKSEASRRLQSTRILELARSCGLE